MKKYLWIAIATLILGACEKETQKENDHISGCDYSFYGAETKSFVVLYSDFENISLNFGKGSLPVMQFGDLFHIALNQLARPHAEVHSEDEAKRNLFEELSAQNSDISYDYNSHQNIHLRDFMFFDEDHDYACYAENFVSVDFITVQAWDQAHPAGSSINDLVMCREVRTKYRYLLSNYTDETLLEPIKDKLIDNMTPIDWRCLSSAYKLDPKFSFVSMPTNPDNFYYTIKLRVVTDTGRTLECESIFTYYTT